MDALLRKPDPIRVLVVISTISFLVACSGNPTVVESTYHDGLLTDTALVKGESNGDWQTLSGDPTLVVNGRLVRESNLPYGGGDEGIRQMEDEQQ